MSDRSQNSTPGLGEGVDAKKGLRLLWAGRTTLVAMTTVGLGLGVLVTTMQTPLYQTHALVQIEPPRAHLNALSNPYPTTALNWYDYQRYSRTQYRIIRSKATADKALRKLDHLGKQPFGDTMDPSASLMSHIVVIPLAGTYLAQITVTHTKPNTAATWANAVAEAYVDQSIENKIETTRNVRHWLQERLRIKKNATSQKSFYETVLRNIDETNIASGLWNNNVFIVERAIVPTGSFHPEPIKNLILALVGGLATGCGLLFLRHYTENTIKEPEDVEYYLRTDCLAVVPRHGDTHDEMVTEAYRSLRTSLLFSRERERGNVVLVTSSLPAEGKSTTTFNVARVLAGAGESTLLLDFDLRRGNLHRRLNLSSRPGLADYCVRDLPLLQSIVQKTRFSNLYAISPGGLSTPALIGSPAVQRMLEEARERYAWVLLDAPPINEVMDPLLYAKLSDMVLMVVRYNKVDRKLVRRSVNSIRKANARVIGAVLNGVDPESYGDNGHSDRYYRERPTQPATVTPIFRKVVRKAR